MFDRLSETISFCANKWIILIGIVRVSYVYLK